ncbi:MAG: hypothetical protein ACK2UH_02360 [Candidatus Promineifilaceae bacterium]
MHFGPCAAQTRSPTRMAAFAQEIGYTYRGKHHEIHLGDSRRAKPENQKTVLHQPERVDSGQLTAFNRRPS